MCCFDSVNREFADCIGCCWTLKWWLISESNQGHNDFQSFALPTELISRNKKSLNKSKWWLISESNQGHNDFQSFALPTELISQILFY